MSDIKDVAAVAVADDEWGEAVGVVIVPTDMTAPPEIEAIKTHVEINSVPAACRHRSNSQKNYPIMRPANFYASFKG